MFDISKKGMEEMEAKSQFADMMLEILVKAGDKGAMLLKKHREFGKIVEKFVKCENTTGKQFEKAINLFDQFSQLLDEVLKEEKEEE